MRASPFAFLAPTSYPELLATAREHAEDGKLLAGGQSLLPMLNLRLLRPAVVIAIGGHLSGEIRSDGRELVIPAGTRHCELMRNELVRTRLPTLALAAGHIGNVRVRNRGTIGGSISHADATAELPCVLSALGATIVVASSGGVRELAADRSIVTWFTSALEPGEVVHSVRVPLRRSKGAFLEFARRPGDFALVEVSVVVDLGEGDAIRAARIVLGGVSDRPAVFEEEPTTILRQEPDVARAARALGEAIAGSIQPFSDHRASAAYRRAVARALVSDAVVRAMSGPSTA